MLNETIITGIAFGILAFALKVDVKVSAGIAVALWVLLLFKGIGH
jgi:hypothetical protein